MKRRRKTLRYRAWEMRLVLLVQLFYTTTLLSGCWFPTISEGPEPPSKSPPDPWQCLHICYPALSGQRGTSSFVSKTHFMQDSRILHTSLGAYSWESKLTKKYSDFSFPAKTKAFSCLCHWLLVSKKEIILFLAAPIAGNLHSFYTSYACSKSIDIH